MTGQRTEISVRPAGAGRRGVKGNNVEDTTEEKVIRSPRALMQRVMLTILGVQLRGGDQPRGSSSFPGIGGAVTRARVPPIGGSAVELFRVCAQHRRNAGMGWVINMTAASTECHYCKIASLKV